MYISRATKSDIPAIEHLLAPSGKFLFSKRAINKVDLAYQVRNEEGRLVGFIWCGLMAGKSVGYIDHFCIAPDYAKQGIAQGLWDHLYKEVKARGIKYLLGNTANDDHQIKTMVGLSKAAQSKSVSVKSWPGVIFAWENKE